MACTAVQSGLLLPKEREPMEIPFSAISAAVLHAGANGHLSIDEARQPNVCLRDAFAVVLGRANARIVVQAGLAGLWIPLAGRTALSTMSTHVVAGKGSVYASDSQRRLTVDIGRNGGCVGIVARQHVWSAALAPWQTTSMHPYAVLPGLHGARPALRRRLFRCVRDALRGGAAPRPNFSLLASSLTELQAEFETLIQRCPGTSILARRSNFFRLQRAINQILFSEKEQPKVTELASIANYSLHQFIRVFSKVYGCTPRTYMSRLQAARAQAILVNSNLAVRDVAAALGIGSRATFARMVKKNFGQSATLMRRVVRAP